MSTTLTLELPRDAFSILRTSSDEFGRVLRLAAAVKWYEIGRISRGKAAELAGLSRSAFLKALSSYDVSPFQLTPQDLGSELDGALGQEAGTDV